MSCLWVLAFLAWFQNPDTRFLQETGCLDPKPAIQLKAAAKPTQVEVMATLQSKAKGRVPAGKLTQDQGEGWLWLTLRNGDKDGPKILGSYERHGDQLLFQPRYPLEHGKTYRAYLITNSESDPSTADYKVPPRPPTKPGEVTKIYPTSDVLPANHLRFYIYFSRPMRGGQDIFKQIKILDARGNPVVDPWLHDELWDEDDCLLILYIHPGRIKWGVELRELLGPALLPDREYSLVIPAEMLDADGQRLGKDHVKKFRATAEDRTRIELADLKIKAPAADSQQPLVVEFPKILDRMSLSHNLKVVDAGGQTVRGTQQIGRDGRSWSFLPSHPWQADKYSVVVDAKLEDSAGNNPLRPFDVDLRAPIPPRQDLELPFRPVK